MSKISMRKIVVDGREWKWGVGRQNVVARAVDTAECRYIDFSRLTGISWNDIDRSQWKRTFNIQPHHIERWLNNSLQITENKI